MKVFPELNTNRLKLRKVEPDDISSILKYANNKKISDNILNVPHPYKPEDAIFWMNFALQGFKNKERFVFAIVLKEINEFIGAIGLHINGAHNLAEMGYWIGEPFWNKGIMTEAVKEILEFGFRKLDLNKIYATHFIDNKASGKVLINNGMIKEAELKDHYKVNDIYKTVFQYRLTKPEYDEKNKTGGE
jgi:RimJ/RimL family protein N-acetyltransferase